MALVAIVTEALPVAGLTPLVTRSVPPLTLTCEVASRVPPAVKFSVPAFCLVMVRAVPPSLSAPKASAADARTVIGNVERGVTAKGHSTDSSQRQSVTSVGAGAAAGDGQRVRSHASTVR